MSIKIKSPEFILTADSEIVHLFLIEDSLIISKILKHLNLKSEDNLASVYFSSLTINGCVQIWDLQKRKSLIKIETKLKKTFWANLTIISEDIKFFILSREEGLYNFNGLSPDFNKNPIKKITVLVHPGFCKPILIKDNSNSQQQLILQSSSRSDNDYPQNFKLIKTQEQSNTDIFDILKLSTSASFVIPVYSLSPNDSEKISLFYGSEDGKVYLSNTFTLNNIQQTTSSISIDLKENFPSSSEDQISDDDKSDLLPLCSDGDHKKGLYLVGTSSFFHFLIKISQNEKDSQFKMTIEKVHKSRNRGISAISLRNDCKIIVIASWDTQIATFHFPSFDPIANFNYSSKPCSSFLSLTRSFPSKSKSNFVLLSASQDKTLAVWNFLNEVPTINC